MPLSEVDPHHPPYLALLDLVVYKIHCYSMRPWMDKQTQDVADAYKLVQVVLQQRRISLSKTQKQVVLSGFDEMMKYSKVERGWWEFALDLKE